PFLSQDQRALYTEYTVNVLQSIKPLSLAPNTAIAVLRRGGEARLSDGRVVKLQVGGEADQLLVGHQVLLFLTYQAQAQAYLILKMWHIQQGVLKASFPDDVARVSKGMSEYSGRTLAEVVTILRAKANP